MFTGSSICLVSFAANELIWRDPICVVLYQNQPRFTIDDQPVTRQGQAASISSASLPLPLADSAVYGETHRFLSLCRTDGRFLVGWRQDVRYFPAAPPWACLAPCHMPHAACRMPWMDLWRHLSQTYFYEACEMR